MKNNLKIYLINPRGFCAGVTRAIDIVEKSLQKFSTPVYIRHEIVHNKTVVENLKNKGVTFTKELDEIPNNALTIFSAHGVSEAIENEAINRNLHYIDATCPLVKKVHKDGLDYYQKGYQIVLIGHRGHPELEGTYGRIPGNTFIVENIEDAQNIKLDPKKPIAYITQTTLSIDDTKEIVEVLSSRFPHMEIPSSKTICYATQNRQNAVKQIINKIELLIVIGSKNSSNSNRLKEIGTKNNKPAFLIDNATELPFAILQKVRTIAISAGASAPESTVQEIITKLKEKFNVSIEEYEHIEENIKFILPKELRDKKNMNL